MRLIEIPTEEIRERIFCEGFDRKMEELNISDPFEMPADAIRSIDAIDRILTLLESWHSRLESHGERKANKRLLNCLGWRTILSPEFEIVRERWIEGTLPWEAEVEDEEVILEEEVGAVVKELRREGKRILKAGSNVFVQPKRKKGTKKFEGYVVEVYDNNFVKIFVGNLGQAITVPADEFVNGRK